MGSFRFVLFVGMSWLLNWLGNCWFMSGFRVRSGRVKRVRRGRRVW